MTTPDCVVIGGGGHARVVLDALLVSGVARPVAILDADRTRHGSAIMGVEIVGGEETLSKLFQSGVRGFVMGLGGVGGNRPRKRLYQFLLEEGFEPISFVHPAAYVSQHAQIARGVQVLPGAVINANAIVAENTIVNSRAVIEHDADVASHCHIAPGACLCGAVNVGDGAHIGAGAVIRQGVRIGGWAVVGMGAVVLSDVAGNTTVVGNPARILSKN